MRIPNPLFFLLSTLISISSAYGADNLYNLYENLEPKEQDGLLAELEKEGLTVEDLREVDYEISGEKEKGKLEISTAHSEDEAEVKKYNTLIRIGAGYLYPLGPLVNLDFVLVNQQKNRRVLAFSLELASNMTFARGSVSMATAKLQLYIGKHGTYVGPLYQNIIVHNPLISGTNTFSVNAYGLTIGQEVNIKKVNMNFFAFSSVGGMDLNPKLFMFLGGGVKVSLSITTGSKRK